MASCTTQERLLQSAALIFAEKGYEHTTINEICEAANANIAAVNYHFGGKENFYEQVWRFAEKRSDEAFPLFLDKDDAHTPEEELKHFILQQMRRAFAKGEASHFSKLLLRELVDPTVAISKIHDEVFKPRRARIMKILGKLFGGTAPEATIRRLTYSLISQCVFINFHPRIRNDILKIDCSATSKEDQLAEHIYDIMMAGIANERRRLED